MTLEDWLRQDRTLADQLKVVEGLCGALNEGHQRGDVHRGLEPATIEVASDGSCDLGAALSSGSAGSRYRAPEVVEGAAPSLQSDIYSAGVIFYEMLSGRSPAPDRPSPLADLRPDVPRDLTDAIMGCLEKGPDWRPKDLSYLLQVVRSLRSQGAGKGVKTPARASDGPKSAARSSAGPSNRRAAAKAGSSSNLPLFVAAALLVVGAGVGAWFWFKGSSSAGGPRTAAGRPTPAPVTSTTLAIAAEPTPPPVTVATPAPGAKPTPAVAATPTPASEVAPRAVATPTPTPTPVTLAPRAAEPAPTPTPVPTPTPAPVAAAPTPEEVAAPAEPTVLTAVSPLQVKRGGTTIFDVRGTGLRSSQRATILRIKELPNGISVVRQKFVNAGLVQVIVKLEETAAPGAYGLAMSDPGGASSNSLSFTVGK